MNLSHRPHAVHLATCLLLLCTCAAVQAAQPAATKADYVAACATLTGFQGEFETRITAAQWITASGTEPWISPDGFRGPTTVKVPFCRVAGEVRPVAGSVIGFELWLPAPDRWNGRFFGTASGGSMGAIQYAALSMPLENGFAAMGHDNGHKSANTYEQNWAFDMETREVHQEKLVDFGSRAQHVATVVSKAAVAAYYGEPVRHAYFVACSQGGHHGLMAAQRHPEDYDGIVAGAHGGEWTGMVASQAWAVFHAYKNDRAGAISAEMAIAVNRRVVEQCDGLDGVLDRQIEDPRACDFDPAIMQCSSATPEGQPCLTPAQVAALRAIYAGPRTAAGRQLAPGFLPGSEQPWWPWTDTLDLISGSYHDFYRLLVHKDPDWDLRSIDWEKDVDKGRAVMGPIYDATDPELSRFHERGGKLIMYHGWSDPLIPPQLSLDTWEAVNEHMGTEKAAEFARLFMIPGMGHCAYGTLGGTRDLHDATWLAAIQNWVEKGIAPDAETPEGTVIGSGNVDGYPRTRPYCPYPKVARHVGVGSVNRAANFTCQLPE